MAKKSVQAKPETSASISSNSAKSRHTKKAATVSHSAVGSKSLVRTSKSDQVLALLKRANGATLDDLTKATRWQSHSVRGFLSGAVRKRMGLRVVSELNERGLRRYRIAGEAEA